MHTDRVILEMLIPSFLVLLLLITGFLLTGRVGEHINTVLPDQVLLNSTSLSRDGASVRGFWPSLSNLSFTWVFPWCGSVANFLGCYTCDISP